MVLWCHMRFANKRDRTFLREVGWPLGGTAFFLLVQTFLGWSEGALFLVALVAVAISFAPGFHRGEIALFITGLLYGIVIEVGLGLVHRQQLWTDASLYGVPLWLPIVWGIGFIYIGRLAVFIRRMHE